MMPFWDLGCPPQTTNLGVIESLRARHASAKLSVFLKN
jgi:hypothetical protein